VGLSGQLHASAALYLRRRYPIGGLKARNAPYAIDKWPFRTTITTLTESSSSVGSDVRCPFVNKEIAPANCIFKCNSVFTVHTAQDKLMLAK
jgi:hypothetical protein